MHLGGAGLAVAAAAQFAPGRSGAKPPKPQATFRDGRWNMIGRATFPKLVLIFVMPIGRLGGLEALELRCWLLMWSVHQ
jgi:hypothetical protein